MMLIEQIMESVGDAIDERASVTAVQALREEAQIELAVVRDELLSKIEGRLFGVMLADFDPDQFRRAVGDLRADLTKNVAALSAKIDEIGERADRVDARRRYDRNSWHKESRELVGKISELISRQAQIDGKRIDALASDLRRLRAELVDAEVLPERELPLIALPTSEWAGT